MCFCATAVWTLETTTQFDQHEDLIHVQHNDGTGACINMSLASSLWGHTQDSMTAHVHTHTHSYWLCNYSSKRSYSGPRDTHLYITSRHPGKQRWWSRLFVITVTDDSCTHVIMSTDNSIIISIRWEERDRSARQHTRLSNRRTITVSLQKRNTQTTNHWPHTHGINKYNDYHVTLTKLIYKCS